MGNELKQQITHFQIQQAQSRPIYANFPMSAPSNVGPNAFFGHMMHNFGQNQSISQMMNNNNRHFQAQSISQMVNNNSNNPHFPAQSISQMMNNHNSSTSQQISHHPQFNNTVSNPIINNMAYLSIPPPPNEPPPTNPGMGE